MIESQKIQQEKVSTHSRPKAAGLQSKNIDFIVEVSTHSRPKAAETKQSKQSIYGISFNTQPPEGGCDVSVLLPIRPDVSTHSRPKAAASLVDCFRGVFRFQHTAARRRLGGTTIKGAINHVSTHSRPKAADQCRNVPSIRQPFQHTAARRRLGVSVHRPPSVGVSTHSRPKAAEPLLKALFHQVSQPRFR